MRKILFICKLYEIKLEKKKLLGDLNPINAPTGSLVINKTLIPKNVSFLYDDVSIIVEAIFLEYFGEPLPFNSLICYRNTPLYWNQKCRKCPGQKKSAKEFHVSCQVL